MNRSVPGREVFVLDGCRTPFQKSGTGFSDLNSYDLARMALAGILRRSGIDPEAIKLVVLGTVISQLRTSNVARESALAAGIPAATPAFTVTQACISANRAIKCAAEAVRAGDADLAVAGGTESLTDIPILFRKRFRKKLVESQKSKSWLDYWGLLRGLRISDLLPEVPGIAEFSTGLTMGEDCERLASRYGVTREEQDAYAARSHQLAARAATGGFLSRDIEPAWIPPQFEMIDFDNGVRSDTTVEKLARLKPAFVKPYGNVTAGNSSFLTDGAAVVLLGSEEGARISGVTPRILLRDAVMTGQNPEDSLLLGPAFAIPRLLKRGGVELKDIGVFEFHEAFAGQILANLKCLDSDNFARTQLNLPSRFGEVPLERLNLWGGSLSLGHPFGATGARLISTAGRRLIEEDQELALVASCAAGGLGSAVLLQRLN